MENYTRAFSQSESGKYFELIIIMLISYPDLPRPREREISLFSGKQSEIWVRDYNNAQVFYGTV